MLTLAIDWMNVLTAFLVLVFVVISVLMILTVLIQRPAGGGLSGAFGSGAGSGQTAFGTKTGDALTIATITMFVLFLLFAIILNFYARPPVPANTATTVSAPAGSTNDGAAPAAPTGDGAPPAQPVEPPASGEQPAPPDPSGPPPSSAPPR